MSSTQSPIPSLAQTRTSSPVPIMDIRHLSRQIDTQYRSWMMRMNGGTSPTFHSAAFADWYVHASASPGQMALFMADAASRWARLASHAIDSVANPEDTGSCASIAKTDHRFDGAEWNSWPYNIWRDAFLLGEEWVGECATRVDGVNETNSHLVGFTARQFWDALSPSNFPVTNPVIIERMQRTNGGSLMRGTRHLIEDFNKVSGLQKEYSSSHLVGRDVAISPGKVVFRNRLIELIQYAPTTEQVHPEPILLVPAWIMKYYILDLAPQHSLIRHLVAQGFTVFVISWHNPTAADADLGMNDYLNLGIRAALDAVNAICPHAAIHTAGYCIGGTLLAIAAAAMARDGDNRLASVTLLTAQTDFTEAGELKLFITPSQLSFLRAMMAEQGYLDSKQMGGAFQMLRANDLIWSRITHEYWMGERAQSNDMMDWNADGTRMPARMHGEYLEKLFLKNELAEGHYLVDGRPVALADIHIPIFALGTESDHVAPWRSAYKINLFSPAEITFALTNGGHNMGVIAEPGHPGRRHHILTRPAGGATLDPDYWLEHAEKHDGSWWCSWTRWLRDRSGHPVSPPAIGAPDQGFAPICDAPGTYVLEK